MNGEDDDDIRQWLQELAASDPITRVREFRRHHPDTPIPPDLEFAAKIEAVIADDESPLSAEQEIAARIDEELANEPRPGPRGKDWHAGAFLRLDYLTKHGGKSKKSASALITAELEAEGFSIEPDSLLRQYQRYQIQQLLSEFGDAVRDDHEAKGVAALREIARRAKRDGRQKKLLKK